ncbi:MAG: NrfD/PsrC family molybdoenzyme membrane anchor subunit [Gemmatimonadota bacterium]|nr:NrfD/PsrC family molybdoenzyme membrane anchor subunit [Gemmatimonadota bacterium]
MTAPGYFGRPVVKPPVWTWEVPLYFFVGGMAGMAAVVAAAAYLAAADPGLVRAAVWLAVGGSAVSTVLLVMDLGRPARFLNMLRVFKWRSPMSVGAWTLSAFGAHAGAAALLLEWIGPAAPPAEVVPFLRVLLWLALAGAAVYGAVLATYTGVLIGATVIPAWFSRHRGLPLHFGAAGLGSAAAALVLLGFDEPALVALGAAAAAVETGFGAWIEARRHGAADRALREGRSGWMLRSSGALAGPAALVLWLAGAAPWAAGVFLAGALLGRYGWMEAGRASGRDPEATFAAQQGG